MWKAPSKGKNFSHHGDQQLGFPTRVLCRQPSHGQLRTPSMAFLGFAQGFAHLMILVGSQDDLRLI
jgi:hypothetical protein